MRPQLTRSPCSFRVNLIIFINEKNSKRPILVCIIAAVGIVAIVLQLSLFSVPSWPVFAPG